MSNNLVVIQRLRSMCMNWFYSRNRLSINNLTLAQYKDLRVKLYEKLTNHPQYNVLIKPDLDKFIANGDNQGFESLQNIVFRLLDVINKEDNIMKDFE